jgi:hypothetical protein
MVRLLSFHLLLYRNPVARYALEVVAAALGAVLGSSAMVVRRTGG